MSQNQRTRRPPLIQSWQELPILVKLLVPILLVLTIAFLVIVFRIQSPIDDLTANSARVAFSVQGDLYQERITSFLTTQQTNLVEMLNSSPVGAFASAQSTRDSGSMLAAQKALDFYLQNRIVGGIAPYIELQVLDANGASVSDVTASREGTALSSQVVAQADAPSEENTIMQSILS